MKKKIIKEIYFNGADDQDLEIFTRRFLKNGLFWVYIAINTEKRWKSLYKKLPKNEKSAFKNEYNKAFLFCKTYKELTKLFAGKEFDLKNLFLPGEAGIRPEKFIKFERVDELKWKEIIELAA